MRGIRGRFNGTPICNKNIAPAIFRLTVTDVNLTATVIGVLSL